MGTSIGAVIDYLVTGLVAPLKVIDATVQVADNEPGLNSQSLVVIGRSGPDAGDAGSVANEYLELGSALLEETWTLDGYVDCFRPGPAQKPARDAALALYDGVLHFLQADLTLGGNLHRGRYASLTTVTLTQTQDADDTGDSGALRRAVVSFTLRIPNTYTP